MKRIKLRRFGMGWVSGVLLFSRIALSGAADHLPQTVSLPFVVPVPCSEDTRGAVERVDQRKCSEVLTRSDKSGLVDQILEKDRRIRECKYYDYTINVHLLKSSDPKEAKTDLEFCQASGKPNFKRNGVVTCDWGQGEREKNHLGQSCGARGAKNGWGQWELSIKNGIQVAARRKSAERVGSEILKDHSLKITSARCAVGALDYRDQVLPEGKKLSQEILGTESTLSRQSATRFSRLCQENPQSLSGEEAGQVQAACFASAGRAASEALFALIASCEITSRTQMLLAEISDEEASQLNGKAEYCASREGRREERRENGVRGARKQFDSCFDEVMDQYLKELYQRRFSKKAESRSDSAPVFAGLSWMVLLGFLSRRIRIKREIALMVPVSLFLMGVDSCGEKNCLQQRGQELTTESSSEAILKMLDLYTNTKFDKENANDKLNRNKSDNEITLDEFIAYSGDGRAGDTEGNNKKSDDDRFYEDKDISDAKFDSLEKIKAEVGDSPVGACCYSANTLEGTDKVSKVKEARKDFSKNPEAEKYCFGVADGSPADEDPEAEELFGTASGAFASFDKARKLASLGTGNVSEVGADEPSGTFAQGVGAAASAGDSQSSPRTGGGPSRGGGDRDRSNGLKTSAGGVGGGGASPSGMSAGLKTDPAAPETAASTAGATAGATGVGAYTKGGGGVGSSGSGSSSDDDPSAGLTGAHDGLTDFGAGGSDTPALLGEDPEDYFMRTRLDEDLFKKVEKKLRQKESELETTP